MRSPPLPLGISPILSFPWSLHLPSGLGVFDLHTEPGPGLLLERPWSFLLHWFPSSPRRVPPGQIPHRGKSLSVSLGSRGSFRPFPEVALREVPVSVPVPSMFPVVVVVVSPSIVAIPSTSFGEVIVVILFVIVVIRRSPSGERSSASGRIAIPEGFVSDCG